MRAMRMRYGHSPVIQIDGIDGEIAGILGSIPTLFGEEGDTEVMTQDAPSAPAPGATPTAGMKATTKTVQTGPATQAILTAAGAKFKRLPLRKMVVVPAGGGGGSATAVTAVVDDIPFYKRPLVIAGGLVLFAGGAYLLFRRRG